MELISNVTGYVLNLYCSFTEQYTYKIYKIRPKLGRSCRCILMLGHGYEPVVDFVLFILQCYKVPIYLKLLNSLTSLNYIFACPCMAPLTYHVSSQNWMALHDFTQLNWLSFISFQSNWSPDLSWFPLNLLDPLTPFSSPWLYRYFLEYPLLSMGWKKYFLCELFCLTLLELTADTRTHPHTDMSRF